MLDIGSGERKCAPKIEFAIEDDSFVLDVDRYSARIRGKNVSLQSNRRAFLGRSAAALVAASSSLLQTDNTVADIGEADGLMPIIDTHQHLWDLTKFNVPWLGEAPEVLSRSYVTKDYLQATAGLKVVKAVYMEIDVDPTQQIAEAEHVIELSRSADHPTAGAVISGRPNSSGFASYIRRFQDNSLIKGVRQVLHTSAPRGLCLEAQFVASMRLLGELGKSYDLCMRPAELADAVRLVDQCPQTRFIVDHCGNADPKAFLADSTDEPWHKPDQWRRDLGQLARRRHVICKISGIVARTPRGVPASDALAPIINFCLDEFGPDRVVFGGDWPVCLLGAEFGQWVKALKEVISNRSQADQKKLLHDNAERFYFPS